MWSLHVKKWSPYLSIFLPHVQVGGGAGSSGRRNFICMNILNSLFENLLVRSVLVDCHRVIDVNVLVNVDGNCFLILLGRLGYIFFSLYKLISF